MKDVYKNIAELMHKSNPESSFAIEFWDGEILKYGDKPAVALKLKSKDAAGRIIGDGFLGFGETYMNGEIDVDGDLQELLRLGMSINFNEHPLSFSQKLRFAAMHFFNRGTRKGSAQNIAFHYDLGNDFYSTYLDDTMTYSCAYFKTPSDSLERAQLNKYDHICRKLMLEPGESLLDVGCGWAGMLIYAARNYGINGIGNTLSERQYEYGNRKIKELGLEKQIKVVLKDYRELDGQFDKFISIGMFEHVGKKYFPAFFERVSALLKPGSVGLLHTIGKDTYSSGDAWTLRYIFPGGYVPILDEIINGMGKRGFSILDVENLRMHYAKTLDLWSENYSRNIDKVQKMFDENFVRRWRLFLESSAAGFKYSNSRLFQILFSNGLNNELPLTRHHIYN